MYWKTQTDLKRHSGHFLSFMFSFKKGTFGDLIKLNLKVCLSWLKHCLHILLSLCRNPELIPEVHPPAVHSVATRRTDFCNNNFFTQKILRSVRPSCFSFPERRWRWRRRWPRWSWRTARRFRGSPSGQPSRCTLTSARSWSEENNRNESGQWVAESGKRDGARFSIKYLMNGDDE